MRRIVDPAFTTARLARLRLRLCWPSRRRTLRGRGGEGDRRLAHDPPPERLPLELELLHFE
jgi:hypothetical protein